VFELADGRRVTGPVQGCGGTISAVGGVQRLTVEVTHARTGRRLGVYEPSPGHVRVFPNYSAAGNGDPVDVDLRQVLGVRLSTLDQVLEFMRAQSYMECEGADESGGVSYSTRANGDVGECLHGAADVKHARVMRNELQAAFPVKATIDTCDEWVNLYIQILDK